MPEWARDVPDLDREEEFFLDSFWLLHTERQYEMGAIPWSKVDEFASKKSLDDVVKPAFIQVILLIDLFFLGWLTEDNKRKKNPPDIRVKPK